MNKFFIIFYFLFTSTLFGQYNHVINGGFELYTQCPTDYSTPGDIQLERCLGWTAPTEGTSDFFNSCASPFSNVAVPMNYFGYQYAHGGNGYGGFWAYYYDAPLGYSDYHEYLEAIINPPLEPGRTYLISFYVSLAELSNYSASKIGAYIGTEDVVNNGYAPLANIPQILNAASDFVADTNWQLISGYYTASGGEKFVTIGWWGDSLEFDTLLFEHKYSEVESYYYVDDVSIVDTNSHIIVPNTFTPNKDGVNDFWFPSGYKTTKMEIYVYNRWGELVFVGDENNYTWDGSFGNQPCSAGTYFYAILAKGIDNKKIEKKGFIQLFD